MLQSSNLVSVMKSVTHFKNGTNQKNHRIWVNSVLLKTVTIFSFVFFVISTCASQTETSVPEKYFEKIIDVPNVSKNDIYIKANAWFAEYFNSAGSVIEFSDKDAGKIMGNFVFTYTQSLEPWIVKQIISVDIKENRVRFRISDPYVKHNSNNPPMIYRKYRNYQSVSDKKTLERVEKKWEEIYLTFNKYLEKDDDNW